MEYNFVDKISNNYKNYKENTKEALLKFLTLLKPNFYLDKRKTRLLKYFARVYHFADEMKLYHYSGVVGSIKNISDGSDNELTGSGYSLENKDIALLKFIGESCERFSQKVYRKKDLKSFKYKDISSKAIDIFQIASLSKKQLRNPFFKKFNYDENSLFNWTTGRDISTGKKIFIPAQLIYLNYVFGDEPIICAPTSTGTAGGSTLYSALLRSIFETVERDHFLIAYLNKLSLPKIKLDSIKNTQITNLIKLIYRHRFEINLIDLTLDLNIPTYLTIIFDKTGKGAAISMGLKTHFDRRTAILGSMTEAFHPRCWIRRIVEDHPRLLKRINPKNIVTLRDRALYWYSLDKIKDIQFLIRGKVKNIEQQYQTDLNNKNMLKKVIKIFTDNDMKIYFKDVTVPIIKNLGYYVIKTVIPDMIPFYLDERLRYLGGRRLYDVPVKLGYRKKVTEVSLNKMPHPFL